MNRLVLWLILLASAAVACTDPVAERRRDSLGGETSVPRGPMHRPGQPCTWCHDGQFETPEFSIAGTLFSAIDGKSPVSGARISVTDATGHTEVAVSNCAGNFYIEANTWRPQFPITTSVALGAQSQPMKSSVHREASCSACHLKSVGASSPGPVFLFEGAAPAGIPGGCP